MARLSVPGCFALAASVFSLAWATVPAAAAGTLYALTVPGSALEAGCEGPCACPVVARPTYGSFTLAPSGVDPLFAYYDVQGFIASFNNGPGAVAMTGSGKYRIGGEVALLQQLTLDLSVQGGPLQHFDSGLVPVGAPFPGISVRAALHGFACLDSVVAVIASPVAPAGAAPSAERPGLRAIAPNPARGPARIAFVLDRAGPAKLAIVDLAGRRVRTLESALAAPAGAHETAWDGRDDSGRLSPAGVYWAVLNWAGGSDRRRFVKLD